jgi:hypothetical protein
MALVVIKRMFDKTVKHENPTPLEARLDASGQIIQRAVRREALIIGASSKLKGQHYDPRLEELPRMMQSAAIIMETSELDIGSP